MAQQEIRAQRENELAALKKTLDAETAAHEEAIAVMRSKHSKAMEELNEQLESAKKVIACLHGYSKVLRVPSRPLAKCS